MSIVNVLTTILIVVGAVFFLAGTLGLLRFPDTHSRLHALTKADNLGLGFIVAGLLLQAGSIATAAKLIVIWIVVLTASSTSCYLLAAFAARRPLSKG
jgi:multicomponent Na+:H+ antiporter subunit G